MVKNGYRWWKLVNITNFTKGEVTYLAILANFISQVPVGT